MNNYNTIIRAADALQIEANDYKRRLKWIGAICRKETDPIIALKKIEALVNEAPKGGKL